MKRNNKKNGFTLVELLAVIAILAILVIITVPNVINMFTESKKKIFVADNQTLIKSAQTYIIQENLKNPTSSVNIKLSNKCTLGDSTCQELKGFNATFDYCIRITGGKVTESKVRNSEFYVYISNTTTGINPEDSQVSSIVKSDTTNLISCE